MSLKHIQFDELSPEWAEGARTVAGLARLDHVAVDDDGAVHAVDNVARDARPVGVVGSLEAIIKEAVIGSVLERLGYTPSAVTVTPDVGHKPAAKKRPAAKRVRK